MGLSVSAASAVLFSSFIIVFGAMFGAVNSYQDKIQAAQDNNYGLALEKQCTNIGITNIDAINGTITVVNEGSITLDPKALDLIINGTLATDTISNTSIDGHTGSNLWLPQETLKIHTDRNIVEAHIKLVTGCGVAAVSY